MWFRDEIEGKGGKREKGGFDDVAKRKEKREEREKICTE